jgi:NAD(P)-dependent dehydrogenase (short-subunit alcohol dehydrogenase family)
MPPRRWYRSGSGIRFVAVAPRQLLAGTKIGEAAAAAYGAEQGESVDAYMDRRFPVPLDPAGVARAILSIASGEEHPEATLLGLTANGLEVI